MTMPAVFAFFWLYTEHRKDRRLLEQEKKAKSKVEGQEESDSKVAAKWQISGEKKSEVPTMNGVTNAAFEFDRL